jgi:hypothetical protein
MANKFGATSQEAINASKKLAALKDSVDDLNDSSKSLKGSGFEMLKQGFSQIREGLMNLDFDKVKTGLTAMGSGFTSMGQQAKAAFTGIKGAIAATGIGLLVIAIGTIYAYWDDIKGVVSGVTSEQKKLNAEAEKNVKSAQDNLDIISQQENILKLQGKSEKEILNMKIAATAEAIEETKIKLHQQEATRNAQIDAAERNKKILEGAIAFVSAPIFLLLKGIDLAGKAFGEDFGLAKGFTGSIAGLVFDPDEVAADVDASILETEKGLRALENASAGHKLAINNINKEADQKEIEIRNKERERHKERMKEMEEEKKVTQDLLDKLQILRQEDQYAKELLALQNETEAEKANARLITDAEERTKRLGIIDEIYFEKYLDLVDKHYAVEVDGNKKSEKSTTDTVEARLAAFSGLANALSGLAGDNKELAAAGAIIDTFAGANKAFQQGGVAGFVTGGAIIAAGLANVQKIYSTPVGDSGGGGKTPAATTPAPQMMSGAFQLGGGVKPEPMKAFVVTDEMSNSQSQLANIRRRATI